MEAIFLPPGQAVISLALTLFRLLQSALPVISILEIYSPMDTIMPTELHLVVVVAKVLKVLRVYRAYKVCKPRKVQPVVKALKV